jgi:AcrR family transcriptional regulator
MGRKPVRDERRKQILEAVHQCLLEKPFHKTSVKDIAQKAGLNHGALHYYFKNKDEILLEYIEYIEKRFDSLYKDFLENEFIEPGNDLERFHEIFRWTLNEIGFHKEYSKIYIEIWAHAQYNPNVMKKMKNMYSRFRNQFLLEIQDIVASKQDARKISLTILALYEGLSLMSALFSKNDLKFDFDFAKFLEILNTTADQSRQIS